MYVYICIYYGLSGRAGAGGGQGRAGRSHRTATRMEIRWELMTGYYTACPGRAGAGGELEWLPPAHTVAALLTAVPTPASSYRLGLSCSSSLPLCKRP